MLPSRPGLPILFYRRRFFRAALAPCLPKAVRVFLDKCAIVLFRRAALAAFFMFRFAAERCLLVVISVEKGVARIRAGLFS